MTLYLYDETADTFKQLPDMPVDLPHQIQRANQALQEVDTGPSCSKRTCVFPTQHEESMRLSDWMRKANAGTH